MFYVQYIFSVSFVIFEIIKKKALWIYSEFPNEVIYRDFQNTITAKKKLKNPEGSLY
jgi:hypothetical protein